MVHDVDIATSGDASISCSSIVESDYCNIQVVITINCIAYSISKLILPPDRSGRYFSQRNQNKMSEDRNFFWRSDLCRISAGKSFCQHR